MDGPTLMPHSMRNRRSDRDGPYGTTYATSPHPPHRGRPRHDPVRFGDRIVRRGDRHGNHTHGERTDPHGGRGTRHAAAVGAPGHARLDGHQVRVRHRGLRGLHRAPRRPGRPHLHPAGLRGRGDADHDHRGARAGRRAARGAAGLDRPPGAAVRLLPGRHDHGRVVAPRPAAESERRADRRDDHQHLPLRHVRPGAARDSRRRRRQDQG